MPNIERRMVDEIEIEKDLKGNGTGSDRNTLPDFT